MNLDTWKKPVVDPGLAAAALTLSTETTTVYTLPQARESQWAKVVGSPPPLSEVFVKFKRSMANVPFKVEDLGPNPPADAPALPPGRTVDRFLRMGLENAQPDDVLVSEIIAFVDKSWLQANQIHKWSIQFNRLDPQSNTWVPFPSKRTREDDERLFFVVIVPGFSTLAITGSTELSERSFQVTELHISPAAPVAGKPVTLSGKVANQGSERIVHPADLWIDHTIEASSVLTVEPHGEAGFAFTFTRPAGYYHIRVERALLDFAVAEAVQPPSVGGTAPTGGQLPALMAAMALLLFGGYLLARRKR
jgi:PGF-pre-PGF domain-containing protein